MNIQSPYGTFMVVLRIIRESALLYQNKLSKSEASTRIVLIDPLLRGLGWDTLNPNMIDYEKVLPQSRADYALYDCDGKIKVIIEAKPLGGNLGDKGIILNLIMYAIAAGVRDIFLTDGVVWEHYSDFAPGNIGATHTIDITKDNPLDCAVYLIQKVDAAKFWPIGDAGGEIKVDDRLSQQILDLRAEISNLKAALLAVQPPVEKPTLQESPEIETGFTELEKLPPRLTHMEPPKKIRLPDGSVKDIQRWRDILIECCRFVLANTPSITIPLPDMAGKKVKLLDVKPIEGIALHEVVYNHQKIFIYANYDSNHCVRNAMYMLKFLDAKKFNITVAVK